jgi:hypothetical protein
MKEIKSVFSKKNFYFLFKIIFYFFFIQKFC